MEQDDFAELLEKRWKRYRAEQKRRRMKERVVVGALRAAGGTAALLRKMRILKQVRRERVAVE